MIVLCRISCISNGPGNVVTDNSIYQRNSVIHFKYRAKHGVFQPEKRRNAHEACRSNSGFSLNIILIIHDPEIFLSDQGTQFTGI